MEIPSLEKSPITCVELQEPTPIILMDKFADAIAENKDAGLIVAGAIGTSIIIYAIAHSAAKLIRAVRE